MGAGSVVVSVWVNVRALHAEGGKGVPARAVCACGKCNVKLRYAADRVPVPTWLVSHPGFSRSSSTAWPSARWRRSLRSRGRDAYTWCRKGLGVRSVARLQWLRGKVHV